METIEEKNKKILDKIISINCKKLSTFSQHSSINLSNLSMSRVDVSKRDILRDIRYDN